MPAIIEYEVVLDRMQSQGMRCQYYNSGAFGLEPGVPTFFIGWIGADDPTIRPEALAHTRKIADPCESTLADKTVDVWLTQIPGPIWLMPKANWAYELDFGSKAWLPGALIRAGVDPAVLQGRTNSPAIQFGSAEAASFKVLLQTLLVNLLGSDFALAFPNDPIACTVHHHKQIWWVSSDPRIEQF